MNYWECPILDYSFISFNDYFNVSSECGNIFFFLSLFANLKNKNQIETSCPPNKCVNGGKCSTRLDGNYICQCSSPYSGTNCQLGSFTVYLFLPNFFSSPNKIGGMDLNDQTILTNFYHSLISKGTLNWNVANLCGQTGVICDSSNPKRVTQLYSFFLFLFLFFSFFFFLVQHFCIIVHDHRNLQYTQLSGTIPTELGNLSKLQFL